MVDLHVFDPPKPGSAQNLGWLLLNSQLSDETLCSILLEAYRTEIERLAAALLPSPADVFDVVDRTICQAILDRRRYTGDVTGKAWLLALAMSECAGLLPNLARAPIGIESFDPHPYESGHFDLLLQSLENKQALLLVLHYAHGFSPDEIAFILKSPLEPVQELLAKTRERLDAHQRACVLCASPDGSLSTLEPLLKRALSADRPLFDLDENNLPGRGSSILTRVSRQRKILRSRQLKKQILQAGLAVVVLLGVGWFSMLAGAGRAPATIVKKPAVNPTPAQLQERPLPMADPIPIESSLAATLQPDASSQINRLLQLAARSQKNWKTLWADVNIIRYRPTGSGSLPQQIIRKQVWVSQPSSVRIITGPQPGQPSDTYTIRGGKITGQDFETGQTFADTTTQLIPDTDLQKLFVPEKMFQSGGTFTLTGSQTVANRPAWILQWEIPYGPLYLYWVDAQYGVILQRQEYASQDRKILLAETTTSAVSFDAPFSPSIFQPFQYQGNLFASTFSGAPEFADLPSLLAVLPTSKLQPPTGNRLLRPSDLLSCERSPDGSQVAYAAMKDAMTGDTHLSVVNASSPQLALPALPGGITSGDYAFAPDGRRLAFFGCDKTTNFCGIFILDTHTHQHSQLIPLNYADYLFWKPDGRYIALVGFEDGSTILAAKKSSNLLMSEVVALSQDWHFFVIEASTGKIIYKRVFEWSLHSAPTGSPTLSWSTPFKARLPGPDGCF